VPHTDADGDTVRRKLGVIDSESVPQLDAVPVGVRFALSVGDTDLTALGDAIDAVAHGEAVDESVPEPETEPVDDVLALDDALMERVGETVPVTEGVKDTESVSVVVRVMVRVGAAESVMVADDDGESVPETELVAHAV